MSAETIASADARMVRAVEAMERGFVALRTGRASTALVERLHVDYYGTQTPINQVAKVSLIDGRTIGVTPFEKKLTQAIEKAIRESNLGLNPAAAGDMIRVPMPSLTEERRKELAKVVHKEAETAKISVRNVRRESIHALKEALKEKTISENDERRAADDVQKLTDRHIAEIDKLLAQKEAELMAV